MKSFNRFCTAVQDIAGMPIEAIPAYESTEDWPDAVEVLHSPHGDLILHTPAGKGEDPQYQRAALVNAGERLRAVAGPPTANGWRDEHRRAR